MVQAAREAGIRVRGSISCALGCPYQGDVPVASVVDVAQRYLAMHVDEIDVADTIGVGTPQRVRDVMTAVTRVVDPARVSGHFHDTYGQALANILAALETGISIFHTSVAGLGGCPTPRAPPATSPPKTCSTCCAAWTSTPAWTLTPWSTSANGCQPI